MQHIQTQTEWEEEMSVKILDYVRSDLNANFRFMDLALLALEPKANSSLQTFATDGIYLYYSSGQMLRVFQSNPRFLGRAYLHSVLHCVFAHLWLGMGRKRQIWDIACDIVVEYIIDKTDRQCIRRIVTWIRQQLYQELDADARGVSPAIVYGKLLEWEEDKLSAVQKEFYTDDHRYWARDDRQNPLLQSAKKQWQKIANQTDMKRELRGSGDADYEMLLAAQIKAERSRRSYRDFLKKFAVLHEELHADPDEFDLNYYTYGLRLYKNMPLIEPMETREIRKIREFVIVLDTSDSTSGTLVKNFLKETFQILHQREHFFSICKIHILQCDDRVRMDQEIASRNELDQFLSRFTLVGGGGTDFRPAFAYVNQLVEQGIFENLGGLLYFTDGKGIYPKKCPPYQTAFLFLEDFDERSVPPWAMRLRLLPEEFKFHT